MYVDIKIAVLPLVKAFLRKSYNIEPFELHQDNPYGIFLFNALVHFKKVRKLKQSSWILDIDTSYYSEVLCVRLKERTWRKQGSFIDPAKQRGFNAMVLYDLTEKFILYVDTRTADQQVTLTQAFLEFREKFELAEENLTLKTMEKKYERYRYGLTSSKSARKN